MVGIGYQLSVISISEIKLLCAHGIIIYVPMTKRQKTLAKILSGSKNVAFSDFVFLVEGFGFRLSRVSGSHHIFVHAKVKELVNLQVVRGQIKPYQVGQFMNLIERYNLKLEDE